MLGILPQTFFIIVVALPLVLLGGFFYSFVSRNLLLLIVTLLNLALSSLMWLCLLIGVIGITR